MKKISKTRISILKKLWLYLGSIVLLFTSSFSYAYTSDVIINKMRFENVIPAPIVTIRGKVIDGSNGQAIQGVSVRVKGTQIGTVTDANGNFSLNAENNAVLVVTYVGYDANEVSVNGQTVLNIEMQPSSESLNEVVVVGYGTQKRASVTGAVDVVASKAIEGRPVASVSQALQSVSPNLIIQQRTFQPVSGAVNINIRGMGTTNNNDPLIVIDGIVGGDLNLINPNDIDNVSVLKDAGAAAIYGSRSANGVILVTTKKGRRDTKTNIAYNGMYGIQTPRITFQPVHAWENATFKNQSLANSGQGPAFTDEQIEQFRQQGDGDWRLENIIEDSPQQSHNVTISGGSTNNTYLMSFGYFNQNNILVGPGFGAKRYNVRLNQSTSINKFNFSTILSYVKGDYREPPTGTEGIIIDATRGPLYYNFQDDQGNYLSNATVSSNPKAILEKGGYDKSNNDEITGNLSGEYVFSPSFKIRGVFGGTVKANSRFLRRINLDFIPSGNFGNDRRVVDDNYKSLFTNTQLLAEYNKTLGNHDINILLGATNESFKGERNEVQTEQTDPGLGIPTTGTIVVPMIPGTPTTGSFNSNLLTNETSLNSLLGRFSYAYSNKYFIDGSFRYDGSSNFQADSRWGFFPSIGAKWNLTEEDFLSGFREKIGTVMIRSTYGLLGNQNVNPYQYMNTYSINTNVYGFNNTPVSGATRNIANPDLTWEKARKFNIGFDAALLQSRLNVSFEYFSGVTSDILQNREDVPALFGSPLPTFNISRVQNRGWDAKISYDLKGHLFNHSFSANIGDNKNKLLDLSYDVQEYIFQREEFWFVRRVGLPITVYQGYKTNGFYQSPDEVNTYPKFEGTSPDLGDLKYVDQNNDGVIDAKDRVILGNPFPRLTFGFTYNVTFKGFDASFFVQGVGKRDALIRGELVEPYHYGYSGTMYEHQKDFWTPTNTDARWPRVAENGSNSNKANYKIGSDIYLFDASYARLKNVQIGYSLSEKLTSKLHLQKARVYITGQNLLTLSKMKIIDPEQTEFDNRANINAGANSARAYPTPIFYGFGLDIIF